jgi:hypothetical protein
MIPLQYSGYAVVAKRSVGDQPGNDRPRYLTDWKSLPDGFLFAPYKFDPKSVNHPDRHLRSFPTIRLPFPSGDSTTWMDLPYIAFNSQGQIASGREETIALAKGRILFPRNQEDGFAIQSLRAENIVMIPRPKHPKDYQFIEIDWLTGRSRAVVQNQ